jgi:D-alanyl-D-alanine carboxypeptidase (penicillin-binding protein 5/6)
MPRLLPISLLAPHFISRNFISRNFVSRSLALGMLLLSPAYAYAQGIEGPSLDQVESLQPITPVESTESVAPAAEPTPQPQAPQTEVDTSAPNYTKAREAIVVDFETGTVMLGKNADERMPPSSMSKLMTGYMVFDALKKGEISLQDKFKVSEQAWSKQGSKMFVQLGSEISVEDLLKGVIVQSGNDACIVLAEGLAGSELQFAALMNKKAKEIGLNSSNFTNSTGWPDDNHYMTARDLATLAKRIIEDFPEYYPYYAIREFKYHNITQQNRNLLLNRGVGVDGLKTGHTEVAGYGITVSAKNDGRRVIVVVNGLSSEAERADEAERLVKLAFNNFRNLDVFQSGQKITDARVWLGKEDIVPLVVEQPLRVTLPVATDFKPEIAVEYDDPLPAPVMQGTKVGVISVKIPGGDVVERDLVAGASVERLSFFPRFFQNLKLRIFGG